MQTKSRRASVALASGGLLAFLVELLHMTAVHQADGSVLGVSWDYWARWAVLPFLLVLYGLVELHRHQEDRYGTLGRLGFRITFLGYSMLVIGGVWSEVLFPPHHPLRFLGGLMSLLSIWVVSAGWIVWGGASWGSKSLPGWAAPIPWVVAVVWVGFAAIRRLPWSWGMSDQDL